MLCLLLYLPHLHRIGHLTNVLSMHFEWMCEWITAVCTAASLFLGFYVWTSACHSLPSRAPHNASHLGRSKCPGRKAPVVLEAPSVCQPLRMAFWTASSFLIITWLMNTCAAAQSLSCDSSEPWDYRPPGSSVHRISRVRTLERVAISLLGIFLTKGSNLHPLHCRQILYHWAFGEAHDHVFWLLLLWSETGWWAASSWGCIEGKASIKSCDTQDSWRPIYPSHCSLWFRI